MSKMQSLCIISVLIIILLWLLNPLIRTDENIEEWLFEAVPIGSNINHLEKVAKKKGWKINSSWDGKKTNSDWGGVDGAKVVWVYLGSYRVIFFN